MSAQRSGSAVAPDQRSAFPGFAGVPGWSAVLIAVTMTLAGFAIEAGFGHRDLGTTFAVFFALGCVAAVLAVKRSGLFAAVIQPPLLLFVAIPLAYYLLQGGTFNGLKDALITCGYPLIERFPLMLTTSAVVLAIGLFRWYAGKSEAEAAAAAAGDGRAPRTRMQPQDRQAGPAGFVSRIVSTLTGGGGDAADEAGGRRHSGRPSRTTRPAGRNAPQDRAGRQERQAPSRARHAKPSRGGRPGEERHDDERYGEAPPRSRRRPAERSPRDVRDFEPAPRRRPRPADDIGSRQAPPPPRRDPRRDLRQGPPEYGPRDGRRESPRSAPREARRDPRPMRDSDPFADSYSPRPDYAPRPARRRPEGDPRAGAGPRNGDNYHPVSRVRYRSDDREQR